MADEVQKLILEVQGRDKLAQLNTELEKEQEALQELVEKLRRGQVAQQQFDKAAQQTASEVLRLQQEIKNLAGSGGGGGGQGILQASYAVQDFVSVLSGGQGLGRALASVQNNIPGLLMSFGKGAGFAGVVSVASLAVGGLIDVIGKLWESMKDGEAVDQFKQRLQEVKEEIDRTHKEFEKLRDTPTDMERLSAEGVRAHLAERPNAEKAREAVEKQVTDKEVRASLPGPTRAGLAHAESEAGLTDDQINDIAAREAAGVGDESGEFYSARVKALREAREAAKDQARTTLASGRRNLAERVVTGAAKAGPEGAEARRRLFAAVPELAGYSPEALAEQEADYEENDAPGFEEAESSGKAASRAGRRRRAARRKHEDFRARLKSQQTDAILGRHADEIRDANKAEAMEQADVQGELERSNAAWIRGGPARERREQFNQARALVGRAAASRGFTAENGNAPTPQELDDMARDILGMQQHMGMDPQSAAMQALENKLRQIRSFMQRMQGQQSRQMMGPDQSGKFPLLTPY